MKVTFTIFSLICLVSIISCEAVLLRGAIDSYKNLMATQGGDVLGERYSGLPDNDLHEDNEAKEASQDAGQASLENMEELIDKNKTLIERGFNVLVNQIEKSNWEIQRLFVRGSEQTKWKYEYKGADTGDSKGSFQLKYKVWVDDLVNKLKCELAEDALVTYDTRADNITVNGSPRIGVCEVGKAARKAHPDVLPKEVAFKQEKSPKFNVSQELYKKEEVGKIVSYAEKKLRQFQRVEAGGDSGMEKVAEVVIKKVKVDDDKLVYNLNIHTVGANGEEHSNKMVVKTVPGKDKMKIKEEVKDDERPDSVMKKMKEKKAAEDDAGDGDDN